VQSLGAFKVKVGDNTARGVPLKAHRGSLNLTEFLMVMKLPVPARAAARVIGGIGVALLQEPGL